jgi:hypothetical protein
MKIVKASHYRDIPRNFTGIAEWPDGSKHWYLNGKLHRVDGPARVWPSGTKEWYLNGELHNANGPAVEGADGKKEWHLNGKRHRVDGPAWEGANGTKEWHLNGKLHRVDGPAVEWSDGTKDWYLNGSFVYTLRKPIGNYIVVEDGLPSAMEWLGKPVSTLKVLTAEGIQFIPNLPGI